MNTNKKFWLIWSNVNFPPSDLASKLNELILFLRMELLSVQFTPPRLALEVVKYEFDEKVERIANFRTWWNDEVINNFVSISFFKKLKKIEKVYSLRLNTNQPDDLITIALKSWKFGHFYLKHRSIHRLPLDAKKKVISTDKKLVICRTPSFIQKNEKRKVFNKARWLWTIHLKKKIIA